MRSSTARACARVPRNYPRTQIVPCRHLLEHGTSSFLREILSDTFACSFDNVLGRRATCRRPCCFFSDDVYLSHDFVVLNNATRQNQLIGKYKYKYLCCVQFTQMSKNNNVLEKFTCWFNIGSDNRYSYRIALRRSKDTALHLLSQQIISIERSRLGSKVRGTVQRSRFSAKNPPLRGQR